MDTAHRPAGHTQVLSSQVVIRDVQLTERKSREAGHHTSTFIKDFPYFHIQRAELPFLFPEPVNKYLYRCGGVSKSWSLKDFVKRHKHKCMSSRHYDNTVHFFMCNNCCKILFVYQSQIKCTTTYRLRAYKNGRGSTVVNSYHVSNDFFFFSKSYLVIFFPPPTTLSLSLSLSFCANYYNHLHSASLLCLIHMCNKVKAQEDAHGTHSFGHL